MFWFFCSFFIRKCQNNFPSPTQRLPYVAKGDWRNWKSYPKGTWGRRRVGEGKLFWQLIDIVKVQIQIPNQQQKSVLIEVNKKKSIFRVEKCQ
jgi:hypothetical protein